MSLNNYLITEKTSSVQSKRTGSKEALQKLFQKLKTIKQAQADQEPKSKQSLGLKLSICFFNWLESLLIFLITVNAIFYPNAVSAVYFLYAMGLTLLSLSKNEKKVKIKCIFSLIIMVVAIAAIIIKTVYIVQKDQIDGIVFTEQQVERYKSFGVNIELNAPYLSAMTMFMTYFFDVVQIFLSVVLLLLYKSQLKQIIESKNDASKQIMLLNPLFFKYFRVYSSIVLAIILIDTMFMQSFVQLLILIGLLVICALWSTETDEGYIKRNQILIACQVLFAIQLSFTFVTQVPIIHYDILQTTDAYIVKVFNMFGLLFQSYPTYAIIIHIVSVSLVIQAIQVYKVARKSAIKYLPFQAIIEEEEASLKKQESSTQKQKKMGVLLSRPTNARLSIDVKRAQTSVRSAMKEKNQNMKHKQETTVQETAQKYYKEFSPQIWLWVCRATTFVWCYAYHDYESLFILFWILHSTFISNTALFVKITVYFYLPVFCMIFLFYYIINIPTLVNYSIQTATPDSQELYWDAGLFQFSLPFLEVLLMFLALSPFFFLIKSRKYLKIDNEDVRKRFLTRLTSKDSPTFYYFVFTFIYYLDILVFITIFFSGVNKIDFYHIFLMFFFVAFTLWPLCFKRNFIILLIYADFFVFEKYLYTLYDQFFDPYGFYAGFAQVMGFATEYDQTRKYFRYMPKFQQWFLIFVCFLQYQVYQLLQNEEAVKQYMTDCKTNFKNKNPGSFRFGELFYNLTKSFLIFVVFIAFFFMIIMSEKNLINWGYQIIVGIFLIVYLAVSNYAAPHSGVQRLQKVWNVIIYYTAIVLLSIITFQFLALPEISGALDFTQYYQNLPPGIPQVIGFVVYTTMIWEKFLLYIVYFAVGVIVSKQFKSWNKQIEVEKERNSDYQSYFETENDKNKDHDWDAEYIKVKFTREFMVYKIKKVWPVLDIISQLLFLVTSILIMILANYWQISAVMLFNLTCFISICLFIAQQLYKLRRSEKMNYYSNREQKLLKSSLNFEDIKEYWRVYKMKVNKMQVGIREKIWFLQFIMVVLCLTFIYPSQFLYTFIIDYPRFVKLFNVLIFYTFWGGIYYSPEVISGNRYIYNVYGYIIILLLLILEKGAQKWALNRFGCTSEKVKQFDLLIQNLTRLRLQRTKKDIRKSVISERPEEEEEEKSEASQYRPRPIDFASLKRSNAMRDSKISSSKDSLSDSLLGDNVELYGLKVKKLATNDQRKEEIKKWLTMRYKIKILQGVKTLLEDVILLMLLISAVYKDNIFSLIYLVIILMYAISRKVATLVFVAYVVGCVMIIQYALALSNLNSDNSPMKFPFPFTPQYPAQDGKPGEFIIPWYLYVPFLADNRQWSIYMGIGLSSVKLNGIWIDYLTMGIMQAYFFYFNCQIFTLQYKMGYGSHLQQIVQDYCQESLLEIDQTSEDKEYQRSQVIKKEIQKVKNQLVVHNFYKKGKLLLFMNFHHITILITLLLAILSNSLFSFGYIIACLYMVYKSPKFFSLNQQDYNLDQWLRYFLRPYVFLDITLQIIYQIPIPQMHAGQDSKNSWQNIIGFYQIWELSNDPSQPDEVITQNVVYILLKTFTYFIVSVQIQIFSSKAYKERFVKIDLTKFLIQADIKSRCITYKFNNEKLQKIAKKQEGKKEMEKLLIELKKKLKHWMSIYFSQETMDAQKKQTVVKKMTVVEESKTQSEEEGIDSQQLSIQQKPEGPKQSMVHSRRPSGQQRPQLSQVKEYDEGVLTVEEEFRKRSKKLGICVKLFLIMKRHLTEQVIFIVDDQRLEEVEQDMIQGKVSIQTKLELKMLKDIVELRELRKGKEMEEQEEVKYDLSGMKRTKKYTACGKLTLHYFVLVMEILTTYTEYLCYFFMIVSMMTIAGLITIIYPLIVFGYTILEETTPSKKCWNFILVYTEILILVMFVYQLEFWEALLSANQLQQISYRVGGMHLGLERYNQGEFGELFAYFLPCLLILFTIMAHIQKEKQMGLFEQKETEIESIRQAIARYLKFQDKEKFHAFLNKRSLSEENAALLREEEVDVFKDLTFKRDMKQFNNKFPKSNSIAAINYELYDYSPVESVDLSEIEEFKDIQEVKTPEPQKKSISLLDNDELRRIYKLIVERERLEAIESMTGFQKFQQQVQHITYKNSYFERLFPSQKEQKPGVDLYTLMFAIQFILCIYLIFFYTKMSADVTNNVTDAIEYNSFSGSMVIALFLQITVIVIDRYLYKSKTFIAVQDQPEQFHEKPQVEIKRLDDKTDLFQTSSFIDKSGDKYTFDKIQSEKPLSAMDQMSSRAQSMQGKPSFIQKQRISEKSMGQSEDGDQDLTFETTKITISIVLKFYLQWFLLIFVHSFVFWYFPIEGNMKLQGARYCDKQQMTLGITSCNDFGSNWSLIVFYILYCIYFLASGLQIKYGVPEMRKGVFMMWSYSKVNAYIFRGYMTLPFLFELRTFSDWTFTKTSLDVFQWFNLSTTHAQLYISKTTQAGYRAHKLGEPQTPFMKFIMGFCGLIGILLLIAGPLLLFSTLNPISQTNLVKNAKITFNILIQPSGNDAVNAMNLYSNNYVTELSLITDEQYQVMQFSEYPRTKSFEQNLIQYVQMNNYSDTDWAISYPNRDLLRDEFMAVTLNNSDTIIRLELQYEFDRTEGTGATKAVGAVVKQITMKNYPEVLTGFNRIFTMNCTANRNQQSSVAIQEFFYPAIQLSESEKALMLALDPKGDVSLVGLNLTYSCLDYWVVNQFFTPNNTEANMTQNMNNTGVAFFTFSYKVSPSYFKYSIITFYLSIVLVLAKVLRSGLTVPANNIFIYEITYPDQLLLLCECIYIYRMQSKLEREEELYYVLMDIMRSPEMLKQICGGSLKKKID